MMDNIDFTDYDKITDTLMYLSNNMTLKFCVSLARQAKDKSKKFFASEYVYSSKYIGTDFSRSIYREITYYFLIDIKDDFMAGMVLKPNDVEVLKMLFDMKILQWYFGDKRIYSIIDGKLVLGNYGEPVMFAPTDYKYLAFIPLVMDFEDGKQKEGIRIYQNNSDTYADMDIDTFLRFVNIIKCTDMYGVACSIINYAKIQPYGINQHSQGVGLGSGGFRDESRIERNDRYRGNSREAINKRNNFLENLAKKNKTPED